MTIRLLAFGIAREIIGAQHLRMEMPDAATVYDLRNLINIRFPELKKKVSFAVAVNQEYSDDAVLLSENDEIALIPPVSGG